MSKNTVEISVETVKNLQEKLEWISSTLSFWHFNEVWPMNLIIDICDCLCVSLSHIIDK